MRVRNQRKHDKGYHLHIVPDGEVPKGVRFDHKQQSWRVTLRGAGLGSYAKYEDAVKARRVMEHLDERDKEKIKKYFINLVARRKIPMPLVSGRGGGLKRLIQEERMVL